METLCIIPARAGSKGIKDKNIQKILGKPMIAYTIEASLHSKYIKRTIVSTDSEEYAAICKQYGAEVPFIREQELAKGEIHAVYPVINCIQKLYDLENYFPDIVVMLLPTSPMRKVWHIDEAIEKYLEYRKGSVISVCEASKPPQYIRKIRDGLLYPYEQNKLSPNFQRQQIENLYELNGSVYVTSTETLIKEKTFHVNKIHPYIMERKYSIDINEPLDLEIAEFLLRKEKEND